MINKQNSVEVYMLYYAQPFETCSTKQTGRIYRQVGSFESKPAHAIEVSMTLAQVNCLTQKQSFVFPECFIVMDQQNAASPFVTVVTSDPSVGYEPQPGDLQRP